MLFEPFYNILKLSQSVLKSADKISNLIWLKKHKLCISTFLLLSLGRYLCCWTISPRGYHPPSSQCFYHWVDTSVGGLLVPEGVIGPVFNVSTLI